MYSKALSDEEVLKNYNSQSARYTQWTGTCPLTGASRCLIIVR
jgi:hypothetical protein